MRSVKQGSCVQQFYSRKKLTRLVIKPKSTVPEADAFSTRPSELLNIYEPDGCSLEGLKLTRRAQAHLTVIVYKQLIYFRLTNFWVFAFSFLISEICLIFRVDVPERKMAPQLPRTRRTLLLRAPLKSKVKTSNFEMGFETQL